MVGKYPIADTAFLLSDPARVAILTCLLGGEARPAGELARFAGVSAQAASAHLGKLLDGEMLSLRRVGRHHYYQISKPEVAHVLEALAVMTPMSKPSTLPETESQRALRFARTCYDHLAGQLAVRIWDSLESSGFIAVESGTPDLTESGVGAIGALGIDVAVLRRKKRPLLRACLDWTERKHHMAGALGEALLANFQAKGWLSRNPRSRVIRVTKQGEQAMTNLFSPGK